MDPHVGLDGIRITPLARIATPGGDVMHAMKHTDLGFSAFGEAYFSWVEPGAVKAWKKHKLMTLNLIVPVGLVRFVFHDPQANDPFLAVEIGSTHYARLTVPPGIWFGFSGLATTPSLVLNLANILHDPSESERKGVEHISYDWQAP